MMSKPLSVALQSFRGLLCFFDIVPCEQRDHTIFGHFLGQMPNFGKISNRYGTKCVPKEPALKVRARTRV